eukprot:g1419.t1
MYKLVIVVITSSVNLFHFQVNSQGVSSLESKVKCDPGWYGYGCNRRHCPSGLAWNPGDENSVQPDTFYAVCSNAGYCDSRSGECVCFKGFTGAACERSFCPGHCSGHGSCVKLSELQYENIEYLNLMSLNKMPDEIKRVFRDARNHACQCDPEWTGPECKERLCPYGDDPRTDTTTAVKGTQNNEKDEIQQLSLTGTGAIFGSMLIEFETFHRQIYHTIPLFLPTRVYSDTLSFSGDTITDPWRQLNVFDVGDYLTFSNTESNNNKRCLVTAIVNAGSITCEDASFVNENTGLVSSLKRFRTLKFNAAVISTAENNHLIDYSGSNLLGSTFSPGAILTIKGSLKNDGFYTVLTGSSDNNKIYLSPTIKNEQTYYNVSKVDELMFNSGDNSITFNTASIDAVKKYGNNMLGKLKIFKVGDRILISNTQYNDGIYVVSETPLPLSDKIYLTTSLINETAPIGAVLSREVVIVKEKQIHLERRLGHNAAYASKVQWELENLPQRALPSINVTLEYSNPFEMVYNFTFIDRRTTGDQKLLRCKHEGCDLPGCAPRYNGLFHLSSIENTYDAPGLPVFSIISRGNKSNNILLNSTAFTYDFITLGYRVGTIFQIAGSNLNDGEYTVKAIVNNKELELAQSNNVTNELLPPLGAKLMHKMPIGHIHDSANRGNKCVVSEVVKGTHEKVKCSGRGLCDERHGICECTPYFTGADCSIYFSIIS